MMRVHLSEAQTMSMISDLERAIAVDYEAREQPLPGLVVLPRTGYEVGSVISRKWGITAIGILHACMVKREDGGFDYGQMPTPDDVVGRNLLVLDGVCKSGLTLKHAVDLLYVAGANEVRTGVMMDKPNERAPECSEFVPDYVGVAVLDGSYNVFPWEQFEPKAVEVQAPAEPAA